MQLHTSVVIPTYRRPHDLARCLAALQKQTRQPQEVIVVVRDTDTDTWEFLANFQPAPLTLRTATVQITGVVAAMNAGMTAAQGDIIAFTDDDAAPHPDWISRLEAHYAADERVGGVGGRDWVYHGTQLEDGAREVVGKLHWYGRVTGNHHIGTGSAREVDVLKGVNMSFRSTAVAGRSFDTRMRGTGAQVHFEMAFSFELQRAGWKLIYDPAVAVDHFPAQRFDEDQRRSFNQVAFVNAVHNETLVLLEHLSPLRRVVFIIWALLLGTHDGLGLVQLLRFLPKQGTLAGQKWLASLQGRYQGWSTWRTSNRENTVSTKYLQQGDVK